MYIGNIYLLLLFGQLSFPGKVRPLDCAPKHLFLKEVTVHATHKVLLEVTDASSLINGNPQGILVQLLRPHPINLFIITIIYYYLQ
jgi:hypothetical protein